LRLRDLEQNVATVGDLMAQSLKPSFKACDAKRGGSHVHAAATGAHVERDADDVDAARWLRLRSAGQFNRRDLREFDLVCHCVALQQSKVMSQKQRLFLKVIAGCPIRISVTKGQKAPVLPRKRY
jgi:hypothetical protein